jgi:uncharacterized membrane protein
MNITTMDAINKRPRLKVPATGADWLLELLALAALLTCTGLTVIAWTKFPDTIPIHFNFKGQVDGYGSKDAVLFLLPVMVLLYAGLTVLSRYPRVYNYVVEITEKNAAVQYKLAARLVRTLNFEIMHLFAAIEYFIVRAADTHHFGSPLAFILLGTLAVTATVCLYIVQSKSAG